MVHWRIPGRSSKYRNIRERGIHNLVFDSRGEEARYRELLLLEKAGQIQELQRQVWFELRVPGFDPGPPVLIEKYRADFCYREDGQLRVEDWKGARTAGYRRKRRWMLLVHGIQIIETGPKRRAGKNAVDRRRGGR